MVFVNPIDGELARHELVTGHREPGLQIDRPRANLEFVASRGTFFRTGITVELAQ